MPTYRKLLGRQPRAIEATSGDGTPGATGSQGPAGPTGPAGPSGPSGVVTIVVSRAFEWTGVVSAPGLFSDDLVALSVGAHDDTDENDAEMLDIRAMSAKASAGSMQVSIAFGELTHGPVKINWSAV
jgi:hypothetical protein